ncbi:MAG: hydroxyethylthiazole kinase [Campylobacter sp.]|nr:hydroxyethylthiazole kinase [Campylobacter sp.]
MSLVKIRRQAPLIHCITNIVVANFSANGLLAIGASPVMADGELEVTQMASISNAVSINIGTLNENSKKAMLKATIKANEIDIPCVLDPVGVGATKYRLDFANELLKNGYYNAIRCNAGELLALCGIKSNQKGVDSLVYDANIKDLAQSLATKLNTIVIATGKSDILASKNEVYEISGGDEMVTLVTGSGCLLSKIVAATLACSGDKMQNLKNTLSEYKLAAKISADECKKQGKFSGSFAVKFIDNLMKISLGELK